MAPYAAEMRRAEGEVRLAGGRGAPWMGCEGQAGLPQVGREPGVSRPRVGMVGPEAKEEHVQMPQGPEGKLGARHESPDGPAMSVVSSSAEGQSD